MLQPIRLSAHAYMFMHAHRLPLPLQARAASARQHSFATLLRHSMLQPSHMMAVAPIWLTSWCALMQYCIQAMCIREPSHFITANVPAQCRHSSLWQVLLWRKHVLCKPCRRILNHFVCVVSRWMCTVLGAACTCHSRHGVAFDAPPSTAMLAACIH